MRVHTFELGVFASVLAVIHPGCARLMSNNKQERGQQQQHDEEVTLVEDMNLRSLRVSSGERENN